MKRIDAAGLAPAIQRTASALVGAEAGRISSTRRPARSAYPGGHASRTRRSTRRRRCLGMPRTWTATPGPLCSMRTGPSARSRRSRRRVMVPAARAAARDQRCSAGRPGGRRSAPWRPASQMPWTPTNRSSSRNGRPETMPTSVSLRAASRASECRNPPDIRTASGVRAIGTSVPSKSKMATRPRRRRVSSSSLQSRRSIMGGSGRRFYQRA